MKQKLRRILVHSFILFSTLLSLTSPIPLIQAKEHQAFTISSFNFYQNNEIVTTLFRNQVYAMKINLSIHREIDNPIQENDTIIFDILQLSDSSKGALVIQKTTVSDLIVNLNGIDTKLGTWRILQDPAQIEIVFNDKAKGLYDISDIQLSTSEMVRNNLYVSRTTHLQVFIDHFSKIVAFAGNPLTIYRNDYIYKYAGNASDDTIRWGLNINSKAPHALYSQDTAYQPLTHVYVEDNLGIGTLDFLYISGLIYPPLSLTDLRPGNVNAGVRVEQNFTRVDVDYQKYTTYKSFKDSLNPYEYGVYQINGDNLFVIYFGHLDENGLKYEQYSADLYNNFASTLISQGHYKEEQRQDLVNILKSTYGHENQVQGSILHYLVQLYVKYPTEYGTQTIENSAYFFADGVSSTSTTSATLQGILGDGIAKNKEVLLYKLDSQNNPIKDTQFQLQYFKESTSAWIDFGGIQTSDEAGIIRYNNLPVGKYRFIEITASEGFDKDSLEFYALDGSSSNGEFEIINQESDAITLVAKNKKSATLEVKKTSEDQNKNNLVEANEKVSYTITVRNTGESLAKDVLVKDTLSFILEYIIYMENDSVVVSSNQQTDRLYTIKDLQEGILIDISADETLTFSFEVRAKSELFIDSFYNKAIITDTTFEQPEIEVETEIPTDVSEPSTPVEPETPEPVDPITPTPVDPVTPAPVDPITPTPVDPVTPAPILPNTGISNPIIFSIGLISTGLIIFLIVGQLKNRKS